MSYLASGDIRPRWVRRRRSLGMGQVPGQYAGTTYYAPGSVLPSGQVATTGVLVTGQPVPYAPTPTYTSPTYTPPAVVPASPVAVADEAIRAAELGRTAARELELADAVGEQRKRVLIAQIEQAFKPWATSDDKTLIVNAAQGNPPTAAASPESEFRGNVRNANLYALIRLGALRGLTSPAGIEFVRRGNPSAARTSANNSFNIGVSEAVTEEQNRAANAERILAIYETQFRQLPSQTPGGSPTRPIISPDFQRVWDAFYGPLSGYVRVGVGPRTMLTELTYPVRNRVEEMFQRRAQAVYDAAAPLRQVLDEIPWPHDFFRSFVSYPLSEPSAFYQSIPIWYWEDLWSAGYFNKPIDEIRRDVATWLKANTDALEKHFIGEVERWMKKEEEKQKEKAQMWGIGGFVMQAFGFGMSILLPGIGSLISSVMSGAYKYFSTMKMSEDAKKTMKKILAVMKIDESRMDAFAAWIAKWAAIETPKFTVIIEGREVGRFETAEEASRAAIAGSRVGNRIEFFWGDTSLGLKLRLSTGVVDVPANVEAQIRSMSSEELIAKVDTVARSVEAKAAFPWWIIPLAGVLFG